MGKKAFRENDAKMVCGTEAREGLGVDPIRIIVILTPSPLFPFRSNRFPTGIEMRNASSVWVVPFLLQCLCSYISIYGVDWLQLSGVKWVEDMEKGCSYGGMARR